MSVDCGQVASEHGQKQIAPQSDFGPLGGRLNRPSTPLGRHGLQFVDCRFRLILKRQRDLKDFLLVARGHVIGMDGLAGDGIDPIFCNQAVAFGGAAVHTAVEEPGLHPGRHGHLGLPQVVARIDVDGMKNLAGDHKHASVPHQWKGMTLVLEVRGRCKVPIDVARVPQDAEGPLYQPIGIGVGVLRSSRLMSPIVGALGRSLAADCHARRFEPDRISGSVRYEPLQQIGLLRGVRKAQRSRVRAECVERNGQDAFRRAEVL